MIFRIERILRAHARERAGPDEHESVPSLTITDAVARGDGQAHSFVQTTISAERVKFSRVPVPITRSVSAQDVLAVGRSQ
jgi:hypothetical protein